MEGTEAARALAALRWQGDTVCRVCGRTVTGYRKRMYCSNVCKQKAWRRKHPQGKKAPPGANRT